MDAVGFRYCFTPLAGVLFTVPSRYCALSVTTSSSPWTVVGPASHRISRVRWYSRWLRPNQPSRIRDCHPLWCGVPATSQGRKVLGARKAVLAGGLTTPDPQRLLAWHGSSLGNGPFRSPLLRAWYYLLRLLRCFSSPGSRSPVKPGVSLQASDGLPHSETDGSVRGCRSPSLSLLSSVLHRLVVPRHPPTAHHVLPGLRSPRQHVNRRADSVFDLLPESNIPFQSIYCSSSKLVKCKLSLLVAD